MCLLPRRVWIPTSPLSLENRKAFIFSDFALARELQCHGQEAAMEYMIDFAGVAGAIAASVGLALWIEWVSLRGLMLLMPPRPETRREP
jgi:hypothetical protein